MSFPETGAVLNSFLRRRPNTDNRLPPFVIQCADVGGGTIRNWASTSVGARVFGADGEHPLGRTASRNGSGARFVLSFASSSEPTGTRAGAGLSLLTLSQPPHAQLHL